MKKWVVLALVILMVCLAVFTGKASIADTSIPDNEITSTVNQTDSPLSANATITITMRTPPLPNE